MVKTTQVNILKVIGAVVVIASQIPVECHASNSFEIKKLNCTFSESYFNQTNAHCTLKREDKRNKYVNGQAELIQALDDVRVNAKVYLGSTLADSHFHLLFNITESICTLSKEAKASHLGSVVLPIWEEYTNVPFGCPIPPGNYYLNDIDYDSFSQLIPIDVLSGRYKIDFTAYHKKEHVMSVSVLVTVTATTSTTPSS